MSEDKSYEDIPEETDSEDTYSNDDLYNISSWGADLSFRELITMYDEDELLKPELQRHYVWDKVEASRFIDSILLGLPVPSIFLANTPQGDKLIIDGYQRIMTIYDYVNGIWSKDNRVFKLSNSDKINERWRGLAFKELTEKEQKKIRSTTIHAIVFEQTHPSEDDTSLFQIFERINTGGRILTAQEIRNCVYQGELNKLLFKLNDNSEWRDLYGLKSPEPRMKDMEFILRFLALNNMQFPDDLKGKISLKKHLNTFMECSKNNSQAAIKRFEGNFQNTINFITEHIGDNAFYNISIADDTTFRIRKRFYPTVFDSVCISTNFALSKLGDKIITQDLEDRRLALLQNSEYRKYVSEGTMRCDHIFGRINLACNYLYDINYEK
ncbi:MAG TPA: DUF262 domain-containing protein [Micavibrio sp.]|nr:DUF262 domain-containing protein [Micavibrio sp.]HIL28278.1 DUF262 domain-containing protein [Micavibrio sp.]